MNLLSIFELYYLIGLKESLDYLPTTEKCIDNGHLATKSSHYIA